MAKMRQNTKQEPPEWVQTGDMKKGDVKEGEELIEKKRIGRSPFEIVGNKERGYFVVLGKYRITEPEKTIEEVEKYMKEEIPDFILRAISVYSEITEKK